MVVGLGSSAVELKEVSEVQSSVLIRVELVEQDMNALIVLIASLMSAAGSEFSRSLHRHSLPIFCLFVRIL